MPQTFDPAEFGLDTEDYWKQYAAKKSGGASISAAPPRSAWRVLVDSIHDAMSSAGSGLNAAFIRGNEAERENDLIRSDVQSRGGTPADAEAIIRQNQAQRAAAINEHRAQKALLEADENRRRSPIGKVAAKAADIAGSVIGDINPTYAIPAAGSTALARIMTMGGITGASDLAGQGDEVRHGIRENIDPMEVLTAAGAGMGLQSAGEGIAKGISRAAGAVKVRAGAKLPNYSDLLDTVVSNEGGGTLAHPKTSPKGALGVMQVMPATAKNPGFGIRPWNGKTQEDLARVGRQYLAALNHEFHGNEDMVLAAYNGGVNRVKNYLVRYGDNWLAHMPGETQKYVRDGLRKLGKGGEDLGEVNIVRGEQPSVADQAAANQHLAPSDELSSFLPFVRDENGSSISDIRQKGLDLHQDLIDGRIGTDEYFRRRQELRDEFDRQMYGQDIGVGTQDNDVPINKLPRITEEGLTGDNVTPIAGERTQRRFDQQRAIDELNELGRAFDNKEITADEYAKRLDEIDARGLNAFDPNDISGGADPRDKITSIEDARKAREDKNNNAIIDENLDIADRISRGIDSGHVTPEHLPHIINSRDRIASVLEDFHDTLTPEQKAKIQDNLDSLNMSIEKLQEPITDKHNVPGAWSAKDMRIREQDMKTLGMGKYAGAANEPSLSEALSDFITENLKALDNTPDAKALRDINARWEQAIADLKSGKISIDEHDKIVNPLRAAHSAILERMDKNHADYIKNRDAEAQAYDASAKIKPQDNNGYEKFTPYPQEHSPANEGHYVKRTPGKTLHEYTDAEFKSLSPEDRKALVTEANDKLFYPEREPPATMGQSGPPSRKPYRANKPEDELKAEEGHGDERDYPEIKTSKKLILDKLGDALEQGKPLRREAEEAMSIERKRRLAAAMKARSQKGGEEGFLSELAALKGELGRPKIQSIRHWFTPGEIDQLYNIVKNSPNYEGYESITAQRALKKLLGADHAEIPTAREIELLAKAMPEKAGIWRNLLENEEGSLNLPDSSVKRAIINVAGLPRTLKASFDFSAPFRQGMFLVGRKEFWKAMPGMFKAFFSEGKFHEIQEEIRNRETYDLMNKAGLQITRNQGSLIDREEAFISQFAEKIPGVRHSERAYLAFLNKLRADVFDDFVRKGEELGIDRVQDPHYLRSAARFINAATGRGDIKMVSRNAQLLSNVLFSPKLMASRIQLLNPVFYGNLHPAVRKEAAKSGLIYASTVMSILGMAGAAGANVEMDPRSSDFAKIKVGNTRFDVTGGFQPYVRFYAQFLTGQQKGINDDVVRNVGTTLPFIRDRLPGQDQPKFKPTTRKELVYRFFENKESPNANEVTRLLQESDPVGNPLGSQGSLLPDLYEKATGTTVPNAVNEASEQFMPLIVSDTYQAYKDMGPTGLLTAVPNAAGVGVSTYTPKKKVPEVDLGDFGIGNTVSMKDFQ